MLDTLKIPGEEELLRAKPGQTVALTGINGTLAAALACRAARAGRRTLLVTENDLKASRAADDARQLAGTAAFLPGGEIDLTRAAGSLESSWRRLEALSAVCTEDMKILLIPPDPMDDRNVILEIQAGAGGEEAALFAGDLMRMYLKYADRNQLQASILSLSDTDLGGVNEALLLVTGSEAYARLKYESGVHCVKRVPVTESGGRIHTSTVTVAVMPEAEEVELTIQPEELRIDVFHAHGHGGQGVNTTDSAVRVTHLPTGTVVSCQDERSQLENKAKAIRVLRSRLLDQARTSQEAAYASNRREQVGSGDRSERIRTYYFNHDYVVDHRIGMTLQRVASVMNGELTPLIDALRMAEKTQKLNDLSKAASNASVSDTKRTTDYQIETAAESVADAEETMNNEQSKYDQLCGIYNGKQGATDEAWRVYQEALAKKDAAQKALDEAPEGAENLEELRAALEAARLEADAADKAHQAAKAISDAAADAANAQFFVLKSATKAHHDLQRSYEQTVANAQSSITSAKNSRATNELSLSTDAQEKQINTIEEQLGMSEVTAPISGIVTAVNYKAGDKYAQGPILTIQDTSAYRIRAYVSDYDIADIAVGQKVLIKTRATGNTEFEGVVSFVSPTAAPAVAGSSDATYEVRIDIREPQERLRLDMAASLSIIVDEHPGALTVPYNAVQTAEDGSTFVEVKQADGSFATVPVTVILESNYYTEVAGEGLKEGDEVRTISMTDDFDIYSELF